MCTHTHIYIKDFLINYEYFNNLNSDEDMTKEYYDAGIGMNMRRICTSLYPCPQSIEKVENMYILIPISIPILKLNQYEDFPSKWWQVRVISTDEFI